VSDDDAPRLRYLSEVGLTPGADVLILSRAPFGGPLALRVSGVERLIGPTLAAVVMVERE
jgi:Fe2+ transport system protein FeoA